MWKPKFSIISYSHSVPLSIIRDSRSLYATVTLAIKSLFAYKILQDALVICKSTTHGWLCTRIVHLCWEISSLDYPKLAIVSSNFIIVTPFLDCATVNNKVNECIFTRFKLLPINSSVALLSAYWMDCQPLWIFHANYLIDHHISCVTPVCIISWILLIMPHSWNSLFFNCVVIV